MSRANRPMPSATTPGSCSSGARPHCARSGRIRGVAISREQVLHVAELARLALTEEEVERLGAQLNAILDAVSKVSELDLSDVPPTSHPLDLVNVWRADEPRPPLS